MKKGCIEIGGLLSKRVERSFNNSCRLELTSRHYWVKPLTMDLAPNPEGSAALQMAKWANRYSSIASVNLYYEFILLLSECFDTNLRFLCVALKPNSPRVADRAPIKRVTLDLWSRTPTVQCILQYPSRMSIMNIRVYEYCIYIINTVIVYPYYSYSYPYIGSEWKTARRRQEGLIWDREPTSLNSHISQNDTMRTQCRIEQEYIF